MKIDKGIYVLNDEEVEDGYGKSLKYQTNYTLHKGKMR